MHILLVEDNEGDILLTTETLEETNLSKKISIARDGLEAITLLDSYSFNNQDLPDLVLLDINLPKINGFAVLEHIKKTNTLSHIPVIILTTSGSPADKIMANELKASNYLIKPAEIEDFVIAISKIESLGNLG
ncbi:MAG: response regulator [Bacteroidetes bacterium]|nr:response regulator [Bacteroidota bacterium]